MFQLKYVSFFDYMPVSWLTQSDEIFNQLLSTIHYNQLFIKLTDQTSVKEEQTWMRILFLKSGKILNKQLVCATFKKVFQSWVCQIALVSTNKINNIAFSIQVCKDGMEHLIRLTIIKSSTEEGAETNWPTSTTYL